ncbi:MAG: TonB-dependent receptor plug domain-containing protein [Opitutaceae bacterium]|nr:TonB-dependent receptor plug domain-containing protein [Opitutaceae bacterium]
MHTTRPWNLLCQRLARLGCLALAGIALTLQAADEGDAKSFDIPAGTAENSLKQFAEQSGAGVIFVTDAVKGVPTHSVKGAYSARAALDLLLKDMPLLVTLDEKTGAFAVRRKDDADQTGTQHGQADPAPSTGAPSSPQNRETPAQTSEAPIQLAPFAVSASSNVGYGAGTTSSSGRVVQAYVDVPQSVGVLTSELMEDFHLTDSHLALQSAVPGVFVDVESTNGWVVIRGSNTNILYIDGTVQSGGIYGSMIMPTQFFDRIEVVKGPTSAAFGVGQPGGIINYVTKTPQGKTSTKVSTSASALPDGSRPGYNVMIDSQGYAGNSGKLQYRLVAVQAEGKTSNFGGIPVGTTGAQLALNYKFDAKTNVQFIVANTKEVQPGLDSFRMFYSEAAAEASGVWPFAGNPHPYVVLPRLLRPEDRVQNPGFETNQNRLFRTSLIVTHNFNEGTSLRNALVVDQQEGQYHYGFPTMVATPASNGDILTRSFLIKWPTWSHTTSDTLDFINIHKAPFGVTFKTLIGGDYYVTNLSQSFAVATPTVTFDPYDPHPININRFIDPNKTDGINGFLEVGAWNKRARGYGWYFQEDVSFWQDRIILSGAWRVDYVNSVQASRNGIDSTTNGWLNTKGAPRLALTIKPKSWLSFYGLYSVHKDPPQTGPRYFIQGEPLPQDQFPGITYDAQISYQPEGYTIEGGAKATLLGGKIMASLAIYHEIIKGTISSGEPSGQYVQPDGSITTYGTARVGGPNIHGYEAQITGQLTDRLVFDARYGSTQGHDIPFASGYPALIRFPDTFGFNGKYDFGDLHGNGFFATLGFNWFGRSLIAQNVNLSSKGPGGDPHAYIWQGAQHLVDAGVGYRWGNGRQRVSLFCTNLMNDVVNPHNNGFLPSRQLTANYTISF